MNDDDATDVESARVDVMRAARSFAHAGPLARLMWARRLRRAVRVLETFPMVRPLEGV